MAFIVISIIESEKSFLLKGAYTEAHNINSRAYNSLIYLMSLGVPDPEVIHNAIEAMQITQDVVLEGRLIHPPDIAKTFIDRSIAKKYVPAEWEHPKNKLEHQALAGKNIEVETVVNMRGQKHRAIRFITPIKVQKTCLQCHQNIAEGDTIAAFSTTISLEDIYSNIQRSTITAIILVFIGLVFSIGLLYLALHRLVIMPITTVSKAVQDVATGGDLSSKIKIETTDEIGTLAASFNKMTLNLKTAQDEILSAKSYSENIIKSLSDMLFALDTDGVVKTVNESVVKLLGYSSEEILGRPVQEIIVEDGRNKQGVTLRKTCLEKLIAEENIRDYDVTFRAKDGSKIQLSINGTVLLGPNDKSIGAVLVARDLRQINELLYQIDYARVFSETVISTLPVGVLVLNRPLKVLSANPAINNIFVKTFDLSNNGMYLNDYLSHVGVLEKIEKVEKSQEPLYDIEVTLIGNDNTKQQILNLSIVPLQFKEEQKLEGDRRRLNRPNQRYTDKPENAPSILVLIEDITLKKKLTLDLEKSLKNLQETQGQLVQSGKLAALGELAGGVAHELNNPLTAIFGLSKLVREKVKDPAFEVYPDYALIRDDMKQIVEGATRSRDIVQNLLAFARQSATDFIELNVGDVIKSTFGLFHNQLQTGKIKVEFKIDDDLSKVLGNKNQLQQVFTNLAINAWQAMPDGGDLIVKCLNDGETGLKIIFQDTGKGIRQKDLSHIFEPFFTTKPIGKGTGLGLSLSYGIIENHQGKIDVQSTQDQGTTFTIFLPRPGQQYVL